MVARDEIPPPLPGWIGFHDPNFTPIPDDFFDVLLGVLSDVEVRVLLYIMRRTYGFKKQADQISLSQIVHGITKRDGERLDHGAGVGKNGAINAVRRLEARGVLVVQHNTSAVRGHEATTYSIRKAGMPLVAGNNKGHDTLVAGDNKGGNQLVAQNNKPLLSLPTSLVAGSNIQETAVQEAVIQEDSNHTPPAKTRRNRRISAATPVSAVAPPASNSGTTGPHSPYLAGIIFDHSTELGDAAHKAANSTQAHRLWHASGLDEAAFVALLHAARQRVRTYQGKQGHGTIANKMGYYFRCLADLAGVPTELGAGR